MMQPKVGLLNIKVPMLIPEIIRALSFNHYVDSKRASNKGTVYFQLKKVF